MSVAKGIDVGTANSVRIVPYLIRTSSMDPRAGECVSDRCRLWILAALMEKLEALLCRASIPGASLGVCAPLGSCDANGESMYDCMEAVLMLGVGTTGAVLLPCDDVEGTTGKYEFQSVPPGDWGIVPASVIGA